MSSILIPDGTTDRVNGSPASRSARVIWQREASSRWRSPSSQHSEENTVCPQSAVVRNISAISLMEEVRHVVEQNTVLRSMHDTGLAAWFGGSLMGAVGLNAAAAGIDDPTERLEVSSAGWRRWAPVNLAAIGAHLAGATGILASERRRVVAQRGVGAMSVAKSALTVAALGATAYSRVLGMKLDKAGRVAVEGTTEPTESTPADVSAAQRQQRVAQWTIPVLTGALLVISAVAGEQQKPAAVAQGVGARLTKLVRPKR